jgi:tetratricopeptide (TPR) repeat protein
LAVADFWTGCRVLDLERLDTGMRPFSQPGALWAALSPNGRWLASSAHQRSGVKVWDADTRKLERDLVTGYGFVTVTFSPDDRWLVTGTGTEVAIWAVGSWDEPARRIRCEGILGGTVAFTRDSKVMAVNVSPSRVQLLDLVSGQPLANLEAPESPPIRWLGFSPDGSQLVGAATSATIGTAWVWDLRRVRARLREIGLDWDQPPYPPAADEAQPMKVEVDLGGYDLGFDTGAYIRRADQLVRRGRWAAAAGDLDRALELNPGNHLTWHNVSVLRLELGDTEGYRRACREMLTRFGGTKDPNVAERTAKTCCLTPGAVADYTLARQLADRSVTGTEKHGDYPWFLIARGMAEYRAGKFADAINWLRKSLSPDSEIPVRDGLAYLFLAMAHHRLGQSDDASQAMDRALMMEEKLPKPGGADLGYDWLRFHLVRREVEALLSRVGEPQVGGTPLKKE